MTEQVNYLDLMTRFRRAYASADPDLLREVLGEGFERRKANWTGVRFEGLVEHFAPKLVTQSFTISGSDRGTPFQLAAVDLYTLDDSDLIANKDTYWKYAVS